MDAGSFLVWREEMGLTQEEAAKVLGVSVRTVAGREKGEVPISREVHLACLWVDEHRKQIPVLLRNAEPSFTVVWRALGRERSSEPFRRLFEAQSFAASIRGSVAAGGSPGFQTQVAVAPRAANRAIEAMWIEEADGTRLMEFRFDLDAWMAPMLFGIAQVGLAGGQR